MKTILVDCRRGKGGVAAFIESALAGLQSTQPEGRWLVWGHPRLAKYLWSGAELVPETRDANAMLGHVGVRRLPRVDCALYLHFVRPLLRVPNATVVHDTIPVRYSTSRLARAAWAAWFAALGRTSSLLLTDSDAAAERVARDCRVPLERIRVLDLPVNEALVADVREGRREAPHPTHALYIGQFARHKNLDRLVEAFFSSRYAASGGQLVLAGGSEAHRERLAARIGERGQVEVLGHVSQEALGDLMVRARLVAQPSLEEGFGLPAAEAASSGIPVVVSTVHPLAGVLSDCFPVVEAESVADIAAGIDAAAHMSTEDAAHASARFLQRRAHATPEHLGRQLVEAVRAVRSRRGMG